MNIRNLLLFILLFLPFCLFSTCAECFSADRYLVLRTELGDMVFDLFDDLAPKHVIQISRLVREGDYDGVPFFIVQPGQLVQINDVRSRPKPLTPQQLQKIKPIPGEPSDEIHRLGVLSMAQKMDSPDSAETSFAIMLGPASSLDRKFTVFGKLEEGLDVLRAIENLPVDQNSHLLKPLFIQKAIATASRTELHALKLKTSLTQPNVGLRATRKSELVFIWLTILVYCAATTSFLLLLRRNRRLALATTSLTCFGAVFLLLSVLYSSGYWARWSLLAFAMMLSTFWFFSRFESIDEKK